MTKTEWALPRPPSVSKEDREQDQAECAEIRQALLGRRIVRVGLRSFSDGRGSLAHNPVLYLDNGSCVTFSVEETEHGYYGVQIDVSPPRKRKPKRA